MVKYVRNDTAKAFFMLDKNHPSCIVWHDYRNPCHPELEDYLDVLSQNIDLFHIEGTTLVFFLNGLNTASCQTD